MSYKKMSVITLTIVIAISCVGIYLSTKIDTFGAKLVFVGGPKFYPAMIFGLLIILGVMDLANTLRKQEDKTVEFPNAKYLLFTVGMIAIWVGLWKFLMGFYAATALCSAIMLYVLNPSESKKRKLVTALVVDAILVAFLYVVFSVVFFVNF